MAGIALVVAALLAYGFGQTTPALVIVCIVFGSYFIGSILRAIPRLLFGLIELLTAAHLARAWRRGR